MDTTAPDCPRCRGTMEAGYIADRGHHGSPGEPRWVEGEPQRSFWTGLQTKGRDVLAVTTFRCERCGYLESYATNPAKL